MSEELFGMDWLQFMTQVAMPAWIAVFLLWYMQKAARESAERRRDLEHRVRRELWDMERRLHGYHDDPEPEPERTCDHCRRVLEPGQHQCPSCGAPAA